MTPRVESQMLDGFLRVFLHVSDERSGTDAWVSFAPVPGSSKPREPALVLNVPRVHLVDVAPEVARDLVPVLRAVADELEVSAG